MKALFSGIAAFAVVLAFQPAPQPGPKRAATADQIDAAVDQAKAEAGRSGE